MDDIALSETVDTREAAEILRVTVKSISVFVKAEKLEPVRRGHGLRGAFLFRRADVEALAARRAHLRLCG